MKSQHNVNAQEIKSLHFSIGQFLVILCFCIAALGLHHLYLRIFANAIWVSLFEIYFQDVNQLTEWNSTQNAHLSSIHGLLLSNQLISPRYYNSW